MSHDRKWRKFGWSLVLIALILICIFFVARPYWIDAQISKKVEILEPYLKQRYPGEKWVIKTVPHREKGFEHLNPYYIGVVFDNERDVTYEYWVENENKIYTIAYETKPGYFSELKHFIKD